MVKCLLIKVRALYLEVGSIETLFQECKVKRQYNADCAIPLAVENSIIKQCTGHDC